MTGHDQQAEVSGRWRRPYDSGGFSVLHANLAHLKMGGGYEFAALVRVYIAVAGLLGGHGFTIRRNKVQTNGKDNLIPG